MSSFINIYLGKNCFICCIGNVEPPLKKKNKADIGNVELRRSERGQIPSIHTQPPFTGARKKHPIVHPFEPVDKTRKEKNDRMENVKQKQVRFIL